MQIRTTGLACVLPIVLSALHCGSVFAAPFDPLPENDHSRALRCMATAISYEAGNQALEGQEAVGQVILNRVRDPSFPNTVCGVIFQGSDRRTGCQFSFACDGSLDRPRSAQSMALATMIAERVLAGQNGSIVGGATHYHANYVSPYWAPSLVRVATIGAHIFYRRPGAPDFAALPPGSAAADPVIDWAASTSSTTVAAAPRASSTTARAVIFSPWGLATAQIGPSGTVKPTGN